MAALKLPDFIDVSPRFFESGVNLLIFPEQKKDFYQTICSLDEPNVWQRLADDDKEIEKLIFNRLRNESGHSGTSWACILLHYQKLARTGVPDRFLVKNEKFWMCGYYMPDYFSKFLFAAGVTGIIAALKFN